MRDFDDIQKNMDQVMGALGREYMRPFVQESDAISEVMAMLSDNESRDIYGREITYLACSNLLKGDLAYKFGPMAREKYQQLLAEGKSLRIHPEMSAPESGAYQLSQYKVHTFALRQYAYKDKVGIQKGNICLDLGACFGDTSIWMLEEGARFVFSFEIDRNLQKYLRSNLEKNNYGSRCKIISQGIGRQRGKCYYTPNETNIGNGKISDIKPDTPGFYEIELTTIDAFCLENFVVPDFIKMDIEGAELDALAGAKSTFLHHRPKFAICVYHRCEHRWQIPLLLKDICEDYEFYLKKLSYDCETVLLGAPRLKKKSYQGISLARKSSGEDNREIADRRAPEEIENFTEKKKYFQRLCAKYSVIILVGFKNSRHTHHYIHAEWQRFFLKMGVECIWIDHPNQLGAVQKPGALIVVPDDHLARIYQVNIKFDPECSYLLHQGKYIPNMPKRIKYLKLLEYRKCFSEYLCMLYDQIHVRNFVEAYERSRTLLQPWGTPILEPDFMEPVACRATNKVYFIGAIWPPNKDKLESIRCEFKNMGYELIVVSNVDEQKAVSLKRQSYCAIAPVTNGQIVNEYLTCKVFKDISYGRLSFTDNKAFEKILGESYIPISSFTDVLKITQILPPEVEKAICLRQQKKIRNYTYLDMWINILYYLELFN